MKKSKNLIGLIAAIALMIGSTSCDKLDCIEPIDGCLIECPGFKKMELRNLTGLDGCGWTLLDNMGNKYEPINLNDFIPNPIEGDQVCIKYSNCHNCGSICMVGEIIEITDVCGIDPPVTILPAK